MTPSTAAVVPSDAADVPAGAAATTPGKLGMWFFLITDAMGFGGFLVAYGVMRARAQSWPNPYQRFSIPLTAAMTFALLASSLTATLALLAARQGNRRGTVGWLVATLVGGAGFLGGQAFEYQHLLAAAQPVGLTHDAAASIFYAVTGFHGLHVLVGLVILASLAVVAARGRGSARSIEVGVLFWHFVDFVWVFIFTFMYLLPTV